MAIVRFFYKLRPSQLQEEALWSTIMLKAEEKILIRTALMEYRTLLFKVFKGSAEEKVRIAKVNKLLQGWKV